MSLSCRFFFICEGSHWEARQFGSEVLSYGTLSGEAYLSVSTTHHEANRFLPQSVANLIGNILKLGNCSLLVLAALTIVGYDTCIP